jgi:hypothetical protein
MANFGFAGSSCAKAKEDTVFFDIATKVASGRLETGAGGPVLP